MTAAEFRHWCRFFRKRIPLQAPVRIIRRRNLPRVPCRGAAGVVKDEPVTAYCYRRSGSLGYVIVVQNVRSRELLIESLAHEWAHCMAEPAQRVTRTQFSHDPLFGLAYGECWRITMEEYGHERPKRKHKRKP